MPETTDRLSSLNSAAAICVLRRTLKKTDSWSLFVGIIWLILAAVLYSSTQSTMLAVVFTVGAAIFLAEGIYVIRSCSRLALLLETISFTALALLNLGSFAAFLMAPQHHNGRPPNPVVGIALLYGAVKMGKSYRDYHRLHEQTNEADIEHVSGLLKEALEARPETTLNLVPLKRSGLTMRNLQWRLWMDGEYIYMIGAERVFFKANQPSEVTVYRRSQLAVESLGESWIGSASKIRLLLDGVPLPGNFELAAGMSERMASLTGGVLSAG